MEALNRLVRREGRQQWVSLMTRYGKVSWPGADPRLQEFKSAVISFGRIVWNSSRRSEVGVFRVGIVLPSEGGGKKVLRRRSHFCWKRVVVVLVVGSISGGMFFVWVGLEDLRVFQMVEGVAEWRVLVRWVSLAARTAFVHVLRACLAFWAREMLFGFLWARAWRFFVSCRWVASSGVHQARSFLLCSLITGVAFMIVAFRRASSCSAALSMSSSEHRWSRSRKSSWMWV